MQADKHAVVTLSYELREGNAQGEVIEKTTEDRPFVFLYGAGHLLPQFEDNVKGLEKGGNFTFGIKSEEAYGPANPNAIVDLDKKTFVIDGVLAEDLLVVGRIIPMKDEKGHPLNARVLSVADETVKVDFNHPMAGRDLHFTGEVIDVRKATQEEIDHGHAHGPGGHQH